MFAFSRTYIKENIIRKKIPVYQYLWHYLSYSLKEKVWPTLDQTILRTCNNVKMFCHDIK